MPLGRLPCVRLLAARAGLPPWRAGLLLTLLCAVAVTSSVLFYLQQTRGPLDGPPSREPPEPADSWITLRTSAAPRKTVLLYTPLQGTFANWRRRFGDGFDGCQWSRCELTTDRAALGRADAVLFSLYDMSPDEELPPAAAGQLWLLHEREAPPALGRRHPYRLQAAIAGRFHWALSYHREADIAVPYGAVLPLAERPPPGADRWRAPAAAPGRPETAARRAAEEHRLRQQWRRALGNRTAPVVWVSSHCRTDSRRETYVEQLQQHIDIDIYGQCGNLSCPLSKKGLCMRLFAQHYTFMLAFENALCDDYVTEKFFGALQHGLVPVVLGGADYSRLAPDDSFVDARRFAGPAALAAHLQHLLGRPAELERLRAWRTHYRVYSGPRQLSWWPCELCRRLHDRRARVRRRDPYRALADPRQCHGSWERATAPSGGQRHTQQDPGQ